MNTIQITHALEQDPITSKKFCGVFPSDKLPRTIDKYPCGFVANTDPSSEPRSHWISIYISAERKGSFFDSYGMPAEFYGTSFVDFLNSQSVTSGILINVNCKAIGQMCVASIVYFTLVIEHGDIA